MTKKHHKTQAHTKSIVPRMDKLPHIPSLQTSFSSSSRTKYMWIILLIVPWHHVVPRNKPVYPPPLAVPDHTSFGNMCTWLSPVITQGQTSVNSEKQHPEKHSAQKGRKQSFAFNYEDGYFRLKLCEILDSTSNSKPQIHVPDEKGRLEKTK